MTKYKQYFEKMIEANKAMFDNFMLLHDKYSKDEEKYQETLLKPSEASDTE